MVDVVYSRKDIQNKDEKKTTEDIAVGQLRELSDYFSRANSNSLEDSWLVSNSQLAQEILDSRRKGTKESFQPNLNDSRDQKITIGVTMKPRVVQTITSSSATSSVNRMRRSKYGSPLARKSSSKDNPFPRNCSNDQGTMTQSGTKPAETKFKLGDGGGYHTELQARNREASNDERLQKKLKRLFHDLEKQTNSSTGTLHSANFVKNSRYLFDDHAVFTLSPTSYKALNQSGIGTSMIRIKTNPASKVTTTTSNQVKDPLPRKSSSYSRLPNQTRQNIRTPNSEKRLPRKRRNLSSCMIVLLFTFTAKLLDTVLTDGKARFPRASKVNTSSCNYTGHNWLVSSSVSLSKRNNEDSLEEDTLTAVNSSVNRSIRSSSSNQREVVMKIRKNRRKANTVLKNIQSDSTEKIGRCNVSMSRADVKFDTGTDRDVIPRTEAAVTSSKLKKPGNKRKQLPLPHKQSIGSNNRGRESSPKSPGEKGIFPTKLRLATVLGDLLRTKSPQMRRKF
eukprot:CAMPEP_0115029744 /NCGR_PEP_ID=MMETSP0216-20121206/37229_1 /TAXON_ID=223996 /ORGANISM="Protocruzia adherens, Strain Boccale" /LENGTH=505 /DNA_ID=CAMNT_0002406479 /DNA_START=311 /DNA_END=1828 /DNA_ORIENTATION=+